MAKLRRSFEFYMNLCKQLSEGKMTKDEVKRLLGPADYDSFMRNYFESYQTVKLSHITLMDACYSKNLVKVAKSFAECANAIYKLLDEQQTYREATDIILHAADIPLRQKKAALLNYIKLTTVAGDSIDRMLDEQQRRITELAKQKERLDKAVKQARDAQLLRFLNIL